MSDRSLSCTSLRAAVFVGAMALMAVPRPARADATGATTATPAAAPAQAAPAPATALVAPPPQRFGIDVGLGYLGSVDLAGVVVTSGVRYLLLEHLALSFDIGYGIIRGSVDVQDRWWLIPAVTGVIPVGPVHLDLGGGFGLGETSKYKNWPDYDRAPFTPIWALQLVPTIRGQAMATLPLTSGIDGYARLEVATLVMGGTSIGSRVNNPHPRTEDLIWFDLTIGVQFRIL